MRVLVSIVLGSAVALLPWDTADAPMLALPVAKAKAAHAESRGSRAAPHQATAMDEPAVEGASGDTLAGVASVVAPASPAARLKESGVVGAAPPAANQIRQGHVAGVRELIPGSKTHTEAIASNIGSEEYAATVEPLARLYLAYFNRVPDYEGLDYYIGERERGTALEAIAEEFAGSREFELRYGPVANTEFVDRLFLNVYGIPPDASQRAYWAGQLDSGVTRGQVMLAFSEGAAFRTATGNEVFVAMAYAETLRRAPDPADLARWVRFLDAGNPREAVIAGLIGARRGGP